MTVFLFDLDGTVTSEETLPIIAEHFGIEEEISKMTEETLRGNIPFIESFIRRIYVLGKLPISEISNLLRTVPLNEKIKDFITKHPDQCKVVTGNLDCWIDKLMGKVGCEYYSSSCLKEDDRVKKLTSILKKEQIVRQYHESGETVVFIGDSNNDIEAMREADVSIASGITHEPSNGVFEIADYIVYSEDSLCLLLNQLL